MDFQAAILHSLRAGNWQRGGGQGPQPELIERPTEQEKPPEIADADELAAKRAAFNAEMERRREAHG